MDLWPDFSALGFADSPRGEDTATFKGNAADVDPLGDSRDMGDAGDAGEAGDARHSTDMVDKSVIGDTSVAGISGDTDIPMETTGTTLGEARLGDLEGSRSGVPEACGGAAVSSPGGLAMGGVGDDGLEASGSSPVFDWRFRPDIWGDAARIAARDLTEAASAAVTDSARERMLPLSFRRFTSLWRSGANLDREDDE